MAFGHSKSHTSWAFPDCLGFLETRIKKYEEMTRMKRAKLMVTDYEAYAEIVPEGYWLQLLDAIAHSEGISPDDEGSTEHK